MLPIYKRKISIAGKVCVASVLALVVPIPVVPEFWNNHPILNALLALTVGVSFWYICWATAKAKGYSGWVGILLPFLTIIGLIILIALKDRHKGDTSEITQISPLSTSFRPLETTTTAVGVREQKVPIEDRIAQLDDLRRKGVITDDEFRVRREKILHSL